MGTGTDDASPRERILRAALQLLETSGAESVSTRAITTLAAVQAPAIYRLFGDRDGLLDAAAERAYSIWVEGKGRQPVNEDPVEALRVGWDEAVDFGLKHPAVYRTANLRAVEGLSMRFGRRLLTEKLWRVARSGRLTVTPDHAQALMHAAGLGITLTLINTPVPTRDLRISAVARDAIIAAITADAPVRPPDSVSVAALTLLALLPDSTSLLSEEQQLLCVWLSRLASPQR